MVDTISTQFQHKFAEFTLALLDVFDFVKLGKTESVFGSQSYTFVMSKNFHGQIRSMTQLISKEELESASDVTVIAKALEQKLRTTPKQQ